MTESTLFFCGSVSHSAASKSVTFFAMPDVKGCAIMRYELDLILCYINLLHVVNKDNKVK